MERENMTAVSLTALSYYAGIMHKSINKLTVAMTFMTNLLRLYYYY